MNFSDLERYDYKLPPELIRKTPVEPRDSARLLVYDTQKDAVTIDTFRNLAHYLPSRSLVVLNNTRVLPARLWLRKETGGKIEVFVLVNQLENERGIPVLVDRKATVGQKLFFPNEDYFEVVTQEENIFTAKLKSDVSIFELLDRYGETPIPHYLEGGETRESELRARYQTIFAETGASVAAPTASLHFTERVFESLEAKGIDTAALTLNVGLGTFAPLSEENFREQKLHPEYVEVSEETAQKIRQAKEKEEKIVAVGTTVTRTLETLGQTGGARTYRGKTDIFITPPYDFKVADCLITNFHLPKTSLMLLVDAFLKHKGAPRTVLDIYTIAIDKKIFFYSFGEGMIIL